MERCSDAYHTNQCLPFGYAVMLGFTLRMHQDDFDPADHGLDPDAFDTCFQSIRRLVSDPIFDSVPDTTTTKERGNVIEILQTSSWLAAYVMDQLKHLEAKAQQESRRRRQEKDTAVIVTLH
ncbi:hypothetical protein NCC49_004371 [Naganishia albida]|nr:hypothetical protein NCC49_004371 [Naganishia albida]